MSYFDHAKCPSCRTQFDPERVQVIRGRASCPACGAELGVTDYFGLRAAFAEEDEPTPSLDDLVPGFGGGPRQKPPERPAPSPSAAPAEAQSSSTLARRPSSSEDDEESAPMSVLDRLRKLE